MLENLHQNLKVDSDQRIYGGKCCLVDANQLSILAFLLISGIFSSPVVAGDRFTPYVNFSVVKDDNLYRLDSDDNVSGISKEDTIYQTKAGVAVDLMLSRQQVLADVSVTDNRFENNSNLNYAGQAVDLKWNWL
ncbi:hypothetical protein MNBD_GAMMA04-2115, partial [hydrothermal vent metagenome]